ncbi:unnamed protein product [Fusarium graminearum]|uniref:Chromosome 2, complete genome n=1 Tax=Gibberella zeae (strain ATCC MYA-4620 / CBS 123657 / FGSC 9075 / NRRL 31084 / PH-1) TaxID=229533 RepID=A0A0E0RZG1_GIBZE|nr:hypothetical protein FG05_35435 [Fusarium graminearum]CEF76636.1 unnamed protein product [Fusarium graminearum]CZS79928.1 unnamed protein product [Fusarium graminearum]
MSVIGEASRSHKLATVGVIEQDRYEVGMSEGLSMAKSRDILRVSTVFVRLQRQIRFGRCHPSDMRLDQWQIPTLHAVIASRSTLYSNVHNVSGGRQGAQEIEPFKAISAIRSVRLLGDELD